MRKDHVALMIALAALLLAVLAGCGEAGPETATADVTATAKDVVKEDADDAVPTEETLPEEEDTATEEPPVDEWKIAYANCLNNIMNNVEPICDSLEAFHYGDYGDGYMEGTPYFALADINGDDVPELFVSARKPDTEWIEYSIYRPDGKTYTDPLTGVTGWDPGEKKLYTGHDLSTEVYTLSDGKIEYLESYVDCDGTYEYEAAGKAPVDVSEEEFNAFIKKVYDSDKDFGAEFVPMTEENVIDAIGELENGSYEDCMAAYRKVIDNERNPYEQYHNPIGGWADEFREYVIKFAFAMIDDDEYPELVVYCENEEEPIFLLFSYKDGIIKKNKNIYSYWTIPDRYMEGKGIFVLREMDTTEYFGETVPYFNSSYYRMNGIDLDIIASITSGMRPVYEQGDEDLFMVDTATDTVITYYEGPDDIHENIRVTDEDISELSAAEQMKTEDKAFTDNKLDVLFGFKPSDCKEFEFCSYDEIVPKAR